MGESKHTPGPWVVEGPGGGWGNHVAVVSQAPEAADRHAIYREFQYQAAPDPETQANARLIAAAPQMLEALQEVTEALGRWQNAPPVAQDWFKRARAAIKAATGGGT